MRPQYQSAHYRNCQMPYIFTLSKYPWIVKTNSTNVNTTNTKNTPAKISPVFRSMMPKIKMIKPANNAIMTRPAETITGNPYWDLPVFSDFLFKSLFFIRPIPTSQNGTENINRLYFFVIPIYNATTRNPNQKKSFPIK